MKRNDLLKALADIAGARETELQLVRHGSKHDIYRLGAAKFSIPRHSDINELTAKAIIKGAQNQ